MASPCLKMEVIEMEHVVFDPKRLGKQIGIGATAWVFEYGDNQVIKIFRQKYDQHYVEEEYFRSMVAEQTGLPVPKNYGICQVSGIDEEVEKSSHETLNGCYAYVQERIHGISLMKKIMENPTIEACGDLIADMVALQVKMHEIEAGRLGLRNQREILHLFISWAPLLSEDEKRKMDELLDSLPDNKRICHGDYHMDNVFITEKGLVCIDWCDLTCGNPMADLARSLLIFRCEGLPDSIPKEVVELTIRMRSVCWDFYINAYQRFGGKIDHLEEWLAVVAASRMFCEVDDNKQCMLRVVQEYLANQAKA